MKKVVITLTAVTVAGLAIYAVRRHLKYRAMREKVAEEGYETAHDILYPRRNNFLKNLQYGPVLPD